VLRDPANELEGRTATGAKVIFQASDLNRRGRAILDAARHGAARIRDTNGASLLLLPEEHVEIDRALLEHASNLVTFLEALKVPEESRSTLSYGDWTWARSLDEEDRRELAHEASQLFAIAARERSRTSLAALDDALHAWRVTAEALADPTRQAILLGGHRDEDFIEVGRPPASEAPAD
jgi:hypothetical protein